MPIEFCEVTYLIGLMLIDSMEVLDKTLNEVLFVEIIDLTESLRQQSEELLVDPLHHTAFNDHIAQFVLVTFGDICHQDLVSALFEVDGGLKSEIN